MFDVVNTDKNYEFTFDDGYLIFKKHFLKESYPSFVDVVFSVSNSYRYEIKIPAGTKANVKLPVDDFQSISVQKNNIAIEKEKIEGLESGSFKLDEGNYIVTVSKIKELGD
jgi:hypothetical protein